MTSGFFIGQSDLDKIIASMEKKFEDSIHKLKAEIRESPMTKAEAAKFLKCSENTVDRRFGHLRHVVPNGPIYFYASELEAYIKKQ